MTGLEIAALVSMIAGTGVQMHTQAQAAARQKRAAVESQQRQLMMQNEATKVASREAEQFDPNARRQQQDEIQQQLTGQLEQQVNQPQISAQGAQIGSTIPAGTTDYTIAKAKEQAKTTESLRALASLMGRIGSAGELRKKEATSFGDASGQIGRIAGGANNIAGIDRIGIGTAGQSSIGGMLAGEAFRLYGAAGTPGLGGSTSQAPVDGQLGSGTWSPASERRIPFRANQGGALGSGTFLDPNSPW